MKRFLFVLIVVALAVPAYADSPIGWAAVKALGQNGTTGGGDGATVTVTTHPALSYQAGRSEPLTIFVSGTLTGTADIDIASNKSIIGLGSGATLDGFGLNIPDGQKNIIIRNLTIKNVQVRPDAIQARGSHHIWIDHCDLSDCRDGLIDLTKGCDYVTVSWTKFSDHDKVALLASGTNEFVDYGKARVTYHHNWFDNTVQRNPRVGYGKSHVFNSYYTNVSGYGIGTHTRALVRAENNYFLNSNKPFEQMYRSDDWDANYGDIENVGNIFDNCTSVWTGTGKSFDASKYYDYSSELLSASAVPSAVSAGAGTGAAYARAIVPVPGNGSLDMAVKSPQLTWTDTRDATSWNVYFGASSSPAYQTNVSSRSYYPGNLQPDTVYYWRVDAVTAGGTDTGPLWRFRTAPAKASKPFPTDGDAEAAAYLPEDFYTVKPMELKWAAGFDAAEFDVYLGTSANLDFGDYMDTVTEPTFAPGWLQPGLTYYWRVDTIRSDSSVETGQTWSFTLPAAYIGPGRVEAEHMILGPRYFLEYAPGAASNNWRVKIESGPGSLSAVWDYSARTCNIEVVYLDQSVGQGGIALHVNDELIESWVANDNNNEWMVRDIRGVRLNPGDEIRIEAHSDGGMLTRIDYIDIEALPESDDTEPPTPDPMQFGHRPYALDFHSIAMMAVAAEDESGVEYYFACDAGNCTDSGWQDSPYYVDEGLDPQTEYTYTVKARDKSSNLNETAESEPASAVTREVGMDLVRVNFQHPTSVTPAGYLPDTGQVFAEQDSGLSYGWNFDHTGSARQRNANPDPRLDTIIHFQSGGEWEIDLGNGTYNVTVAIGDAHDSTHTIIVEGVTYWDALFLNAHDFRTKRETVVVNDGRLTITQGSAAHHATRICYVIIERLSSDYTCTSPLAADMNNDCQVDFVDYTLFAHSWISGSLDGDLTGNGVVDLRDMAVLASEWLECNRDPAAMCFQ